MEAERNRRKQLLDTQAQVNVAEGHKQRVILESEGLVSLHPSRRSFVLRTALTRRCLACGEGQRSRGYLQRDRS